MNQHARPSDQFLLNADPSTCKVRIIERLTTLNQLCGGNTQNDSYLDQDQIRDLLVLDQEELEKVETQKVKRVTKNVLTALKKTLSADSFEFELNKRDS